MPAMFAIVGFIVGFAYWRFSGAFQGALFGYLLACIMDFRARLQSLERHLPPPPEEPDLEREPPPVREQERRSETIEPPVSLERSVPPQEPEKPEEHEEADNDSRDVFDRFWDWAKPYLMGPSLIVTVGVVVLFFGVAFLLKYAVERDLFPVELRLASAALGGIVLLVVGFRTRIERPGYGLALQGGGVGILYLTVFAAFRLYALVPGTMAFGLLFLFVVLSAVLAVAQSSLALATLATVGGFLAPVLTSTGEGSHVALFSYYALLNAGILATAWFRRYRLLNLLGFLFTFVISSSWGYRYYRPEYFATTEPFLILFFLLYVAIAVVFALRHSGSRNAFVDGTLVFGVPLVSAVLQSALVREYEYGMAWSALVLGAFYIALALAILRYRPEAARDLGESFLSTGIVFSTLAVPFAFDHLVTSAFWALEGAAMVWVGARQKRLLPRLFGSALSILAGLMFLVDPGPAGTEAVLNARFLGGTLIAVAGLATARNLHRYREILFEEERPLSQGFFFWGLGWWLLNGLHEVAAFTVSHEAELGCDSPFPLGDRGRVDSAGPAARLASSRKSFAGSSSEPVVRGALRRGPARTPIPGNRRARLARRHRRSTPGPEVATSRRSLARGGTLALLYSRRMGVELPGAPRRRRHRLGRRDVGSCAARDSPRHLVPAKDPVVLSDVGGDADRGIPPSLDRRELVLEQLGSESAPLLSRAQSDRSHRASRHSRFFSSGIDASPRSSRKRAYLGAWSKSRLRARPSTGCTASCSARSISVGESPSTL